jgi:hypothetical protein
MHMLVCPLETGRCPSVACLLLRLLKISDHPLSAKLVPTFADRGCHVARVTNPYGRILSFLDRSRYFFFQVAPQLYSRGWVDPVPDPLLLRKSSSAGNRTQTSGLLKISYTNKTVIHNFFCFWRVRNTAYQVVANNCRWFSSVEACSISADVFLPTFYSIVLFNEAVSVTYAVRRVIAQKELV